MTSSDDKRPSQENRRWALKASGQCVLVTILFLLGCGGSKPPLYSVGGTVTGLKGSGLVLQSPGLPDVPLSTTESFLIANAVPTGFSYAATVKVQPVNPTQQCTIVGGSGSVQQSNVSNIVVTCVNTYTLSGTVNLCRDERHRHPCGSGLGGLSAVSARPGHEYKELQF